MEFPSTHWSLLAQATLNGSIPSRRAMEELCGRYWAPIHRFIRSRHVPESDAQDLTQEFMLHLLEKSFFSRADPLLGRFRSFLLGALVRFLADVAERQNALKRGGSRPCFSLGNIEPRDERQEAITAEEAMAFDRDWALRILESALQRLRYEYAERHGESKFVTLEQFLPGAGRIPTYEKAARDLGISLGALKTEVHRLRRRLHALVREEVAQTVSAPHEIEPEMAYLQQVLTGTSL